MDTSANNLTSGRPLDSQSSLAAGDSKYYGRFNMVSNSEKSMSSKYRDNLEAGLGTWMARYSFYLGLSLGAGYSEYFDGFNMVVNSEHGTSSKYRDDLEVELGIWMARYSYTLWFARG